MHQMNNSRLFTLSPAASPAGRPSRSSRTPASNRTSWTSPKPRQHWTTSARNSGYSQAPIVVIDDDFHWSGLNPDCIQRAITALTHTAS